MLDGNKASIGCTLPDDLRGARDAAKATRWGGRNGRSAWILRVLPRCLAIVGLTGFMGCLGSGWNGGGGQYHPTPQPVVTHESHDPMRTKNANG